jgi:hypothetical protein
MGVLGDHGVAAGGVLTADRVLIAVLCLTKRWENTGSNLFAPAKVGHVRLHGAPTCREPLDGMSMGRGERRALGIEPLDVETAIGILPAGKMRLGTYLGLLEE